ncbi:MAG: FkbM family methyltransferase, partial [Pseudomonadota bacterium]
MSTIDRADNLDFFSRFREIIADPLNILIERGPRSGLVTAGMVTLHNGNRVPVDGPNAYYQHFSRILQVNRGVHEPLEEFVFQEVLRHMPDAPVMIELGSYWSHYSMWMQAVHRGATNIMVEADPECLAVGETNFAINRLKGEFINRRVDPSDWTLDSFMEERGLDKVDLFHVDIQGAEKVMMQDVSATLSAQKVDRLLISTHENPIHHGIIDSLSEFGYRIEVDCDPEVESTSFDGF